ncbi:MAG: ABC transporter substrate-binding protein [Anaerolineales bacterium]
MTPAVDGASASPTNGLIMEDPTLTPEPPPLRVLAVCLTQEPTSLFPYADSSLGARAVRQAIYDGPLEIVDYRVQAVILEQVPDITNGGAVLEQVQVRLGDLIVDAAGELTSLAQGVTYLPSGCLESSCAVAYSGVDPVSMDQLAVRFSLRDDISWSDGVPLTAQDSLYSFEIARELFPQVRADLIQHTSSYKALDERSVEWRGVPGYLDPSYQSNFFHPLPEHAWSSVPVEELASAEQSARMPLGWGAYVLDEWVAGDHMTLSKNEGYFRSEEGLPNFDRLVFRFVTDSVEALAALQAGECDLINEVPPDYYPQEALSQVQAMAAVEPFYVQDTAWEQLAFGVQPIDPGSPAFFGGKEVRQAAAQCIDRQQIIQALSLQASQVMDSYIPARHPLFNADAATYTYDPEAGAAALQAAGWVDLDNDPTTPRQAQGVPGVADATPFQVELLVLDNSERDLVAGIIQEGLAQCGIEVQVRSLGAEELFAPGPDGAVFGRQFNLAQFGWPTSQQPPCELFTSAEIPGPYPDYPKGWGGANASGYSRAEYDQACLHARNSLPDDSLHRESHLQAQAYFGEDLPALPLFSRYRVVLARADICGLMPDNLAGSALWNIETLDYGDGCP